jgi:DNA-binding protein Fis
LKEAEDALVAAALRHADGNQGVAAGLLGVSRQALNKRLRRRQLFSGLARA